MKSCFRVPLNKEEVAALYWYSTFHKVVDLCKVAGLNLVFKKTFYLFSKFIIFCMNRSNLWHRDRRINLRLDKLIDYVTNVCGLFFDCRSGIRISLRGSCTHVVAFKGLHVRPCLIISGLGIIKLNLPVLKLSVLFFSCLRLFTNAYYLVLKVISHLFDSLEKLIHSGFPHLSISICFSRSLAFS